MIIKVGKSILPKRDPASLTRSAETLCDVVIIESSLDLKWWLDNGSELVVVEVNEVIEFTGRVDILTEVSDTGKVRVFCRDLTSDLIDCPSIGTGEFKKLTPLQIMKKIVAPFDITINSSIDSIVIPFFGHSLEEKSSNILRRLGQSVGWVITSDGVGGINHWRNTDATVAVQIVKGRNGNFNLKYDFTKKFSTFKALGQGQFSRGQFQLLKQVSGSATRYRPHVMVSDTTTDGTRLAQEAQRVKNYIEGGAISATVLYYGDVRLLPGQKISLISGDIKKELYIKTVTLERKAKVVTRIETVLPGRFGVSE